MISGTVNAVECFACGGTVVAQCPAHGVFYCRTHGKRGRCLLCEEEEQRTREAVRERERRLLIETEARQQGEQLRIEAYRADRRREAEYAASVEQNRGRAARILAVRRLASLGGWLTIPSVIACVILYGLFATPWPLLPPA